MCCGQSARMWCFQAPALSTARSAVTAVGCDQAHGASTGPAVQSGRARPAKSDRRAQGPGRPRWGPHRAGDGNSESESVWAAGPGRRRAPSHSRQGHPGSELASDAPYDARLPAAAASPDLAGGDAEELLPHFCDRGCPLRKGIQTKPTKTSHFLDFSEFIVRVPFFVIWDGFLKVQY